MRQDGLRFVYSHQLAHDAGATAAQVRRDLMVLGPMGTSNKGYATEDLISAIDEVLDSPEGQTIALVGVGNLGRAILAFFAGRRPRLAITAGFDNDPTKAARVIMGCRVYPMAELAQVVLAEGITVGIVAVPATAAQAVADKLVAAGVRGLLNFAPCPLKVPASVHVEDMDITMSLEKVAYYAKHNKEKAVI
jgi:redox-sensing transcriptional repressor